MKREHSQRTYGRTKMDALIWNRLEIICQVLNEKREGLAGLDEEI